jgi:hypothetical protein
MYYQQRALAREHRETNGSEAYLVDAALDPQEEDGDIRVAYSAVNHLPTAMSLKHNRVTTIAGSTGPTTPPTTSDKSERQKKADEGRERSSSSSRA